MGKIYLIRHGAPVPDPAVSSHLWPIDSDKSSQIKAFALRFPDGVSTIYPSTEQKALSTALRLAPLWNARVAQGNPGFDEQQRHTVGWYEDVADFRAAVSQLFDHPNEVVFGEESAVQALARFKNAIAALPKTDDAVAVVTHGTVMALYLADISGRPATYIWQRIQALGMPMGAAVHRHTFDLFA